MAIRKIRTDEDPILRKKSKIVANFNNRLEVLIDDMYETMDVAYGVGLAAPQVGILKRLIVVDNRDEEENKRFYMLNPVILEKEGEEISMEGCLSIPGKQGTVKRAKNIKVKYNDLTGEEKIMEAEDFLARIIQHEMDHLDGILYTDKAIEMYEAKDEED
ncbi:MULTISPECIES: peptide deformylase [Peptoniphilus]|jgi:peptide deformylase|uniref:peptide deformylase n=1 Tax=Peptoniphilus TaxID=162289 RepID=UPI00028834DF|nr:MULTISPECIES: peptide deformylase [Peptoniphilus]MBS6610218.1 peptide deformylase [Peptoniphilus harei]MDU1043290.1 peptide deformylase [Peptoniphilus rhinitidis]MDU1954007.1 peptide deformylase [Peptoniphilus lacydonensis]MDU2109680.1 peptide deformylase [Peptoniphilus lacydonensis]MDU2115245.1 peptide deformylase [Peptoniphilus lacydonensis]